MKVQSVKFLNKSIQKKNEEVIELKFQIHSYFVFLIESKMSLDKQIMWWRMQFYKMKTTHPSPTVSVLIFTIEIRYKRRHCFWIFLKLSYQYEFSKTNVLQSRVTLALRYLYWNPLSWIYPFFNWKYVHWLE